jgi:patatin-like phospholipase/acyl hydrolase
MKNYFEIFSRKKAKRVLSFDGGGVRAIAGVVFLKQLEVATGKSIFDLFDMFIGTSAGGMNALLIAVEKMNASELHEFWSRENILSSMSDSW